MSHKAIRLFGDRHPDSRGPLDYWYRVAKKANWTTLADVKHSFNTADFVPPFVVFDIGGNRFRLVAEINFGRKVLFIWQIMTHREYSKGAWRK